MSVTDGDRERAMVLLDNYDSGPGSMVNLIAAALAEEREKARAPFVAVMARCNTCRANAALVNRPAVAMAYDDAAEWLRRALEETE